MRSCLVEICCGSADDAIAAGACGADRVELNSAMFLGGLTPTAGTLRTVKAHTSVPVMCMIRPREGGFHYTSAEFATAITDAQMLLEEGADGLVFGFLQPDGTVDRERCQALLSLAGGKPCVFHRAIDVIPDWRAALDTLIELGFTRVLTSGQKPSVFFGASTVAEMVQYAANRIEILPGAGVSPETASQILSATGCTQLHMSMHRVSVDPSSEGSDIRFNGVQPPPESSYKTVDKDKLARFLRSLA